LFSNGYFLPTIENLKGSTVPQLSGKPTRAVIMSSYPPKIVIEEQGLRDGLQSERQFMPTEKKLEIIGLVADAGIKRIQVTSFVHPKLVPQMADAEEICKGLDHSRDVLYSGLVLNTKGLQRAANAGLKHVEASISASDSHSRKNANASLPEARQRIAEMIKTGKKHGLMIRGELQPPELRRTCLSLANSSAGKSIQKIS
jgi:hydroxymethylglutaryl-CoA lyase